MKNKIIVSNFIYNILHKVFFLFTVGFLHIKCINKNSGAVGHIQYSSVIFLFNFWYTMPSYRPSLTGYTIFTFEERERDIGRGLTRTDFCLPSLAKAI
jgi:hypothetical protein